MTGMARSVVLVFARMPCIADFIFSIASFFRAFWVMIPPPIMSGMPIQGNPAMERTAPTKPMNFPKPLSPNSNPGEELTINQKIGKSQYGSSPILRHGISPSIPDGDYERYPILSREYEEIPLLSILKGYHSPAIGLVPQVDHGHIEAIRPVLRGPFRFFPYAGGFRPHHISLSWSIGSQRKPRKR